jgi:cold shock CspA family protein
VLTDVQANRRQHYARMMSIFYGELVRQQGKVLRFGAHGYGWAVMDGTRESVFLHIRDMRGRLVPREGDRVEFDLLRTEQGPKALDVALLLIASRGE